MLKQDSPKNSSSRFTTILLAGFLAGLFDISAAMLSYYSRTGKTPLDVLNFVASGLFGKEAFSGQKIMLFWGLLFHFLIAYLFAVLFFFLYPRVRILWKNRILTALLYGLFVWCVMNLIVLPLSNTPKAPFNTAGAIRGALILVLAIAMPLSFIAHRFYAKRSAVHQVQYELQ